MSKPVQIAQSWQEPLKAAFDMDYFEKLRQFLYQEKAQSRIIYPKGSLIFHAFELTPWDKVRVVILGQDPYHGPHQAHGLAFSVLRPTPPPPSLQNIFKELKRDLGLPIPKHGDLSSWARQGVLLLNNVLTVRAGQAHSHQNQGWEEWTDQVIHTLSAQKEHLVFVLWGSAAQKKRILIDDKKHLILSCAHPSPLSAHRGFLGCGHFSTINQYLKAQGDEVIDWSLDP